MDNKSVKELRALAKEKGISLKGCSRKDDILAAIKGGDKPAEEPKVKERKTIGKAKNPVAPRTSKVSSDMRGHYLEIWEGDKCMRKIKCKNQSEAIKLGQKFRL